MRVSLGGSEIIRDRWGGRWYKSMVQKQRCGMNAICEHNASATACTELVRFKHINPNLRNPFKLHIPCICYLEYPNAREATACDGPFQLKTPTTFARHGSFCSVQFWRLLYTQNLLTLPYILWHSSNNTRLCGGSNY